jgi:hypothetical protein
MAWMLEQVEAGRPCDGECGRLATARCHLDAKGTGGYDLGNVVLLCAWCHQASEKRADAYEAETGIPFRAKGRAWAAQYGEELAA